MSTADITGTEQLVETPPAASPAVCVMQSGCGPCVSAGCHWCGGGEICSHACPASVGAAVYRTMDSCLARDAALQAETLVNSTSRSSFLLSVTPSFFRRIQGDDAAGMQAGATTSPRRAESLKVAVLPPHASSPATPPQLAPAGRPADEHQERNALDLAELVRLARHGAAGSELSNGLVAHEARMRGKNVYLRSSDKAQVPSSTLRV